MPNRAHASRAAILCLATIAALGGWNSVARADLLWDNYLTAPDGHDHFTGLGSERRTQVGDAWTADDAVFGTAVRISEVRWIGVRDATFPYATADVLVLDSARNIAFSANDVIYNSSIRGTDFGMQTYEGTITLPDVTLPAGQFYFATRLVGNSLGRNFAASTGNTVRNGLSYGIFRSEFFGFPDWVSSGDALDTGPTDFAFQLYGVSIPEPATLLLFALPFARLIRRR